MSIHGPVAEACLSSVFSRKEMESLIPCSKITLLTSLPSFLIYFSAWTGEANKAHKVKHLRWPWLSGADLDFHNFESECHLKFYFLGASLVVPGRHPFTKCVVTKETKIYILLYSINIFRFLKSLSLPLYASDILSWKLSSLFFWWTLYFSLLSPDNLSLFVAPPFQPVFTFGHTIFGCVSTYFLTPIHLHPKFQSNTYVDVISKFT